MSNHNSNRDWDPSSLQLVSRDVVPQERDWDPSSLQLVSRDVVPQEVAIRGGRRVSSVRDKFIAGPIDVAWLSQARKLGVTALWVGLALWFIRGLRRSDSFFVSNLMLRDWDVSPDAKSRALRKLEEAGLIAIEHRGKRSPRVTLVAPSSRAGKHLSYVATLSVTGTSTPNSQDDFVKTEAHDGRLRIGTAERPLSQQG
jgi:DNA-binding transcriptional ArsR family regulator